MPEAAIRADTPKVFGTPSEIVQAIERTARANAEDRCSRVRSGGFQAISNESVEKQTPADADEVSQEGKLTRLRCPDCGGSLWQRKENGVSRYRCRVGHTFSTETLNEAQFDLLESTLWGAVMALEERADFLRKLQPDRGPQPNQHCSEDIDEIEVQAAQLRALVTSMLSAETAVETA
jgi:two-component system chemotaxis response regulator CheB